MVVEGEVGEDKENVGRREAIKKVRTARRMSLIFPQCNYIDILYQAFVHAYDGYEKHCFGQDEFRPSSKKCKQLINADLNAI